MNHLGISVAPTSLTKALGSVGEDFDGEDFDATSVVK